MIQAAQRQICLFLNDPALGIDHQRIKHQGSMLALMGVLGQ